MELSLSLWHRLLGMVPGRTGKQTGLVGVRNKVAIGQHLGIHAYTPLLPET